MHHNYAARSFITQNWQTVDTINAFRSRFSQHVIKSIARNSKHKIGEQMNREGKKKAQRQMVDKIYGKWKGLLKYDCICILQMEFISLTLFFFHLVFQNGNKKKRVAATITTKTHLILFPLHTFYNEFYWMHRQKATHFRSEPLNV